MLNRAKRACFWSPLLHQGEKSKRKETCRRIKTPREKKLSWDLPDLQHGFGRILQWTVKTVTAGYRAAILRPYGPAIICLMSVSRRVPYSRLVCHP